MSTPGFEREVIERLTRIETQQKNVLFPLAKLVSRHEKHFNIGKGVMAVLSALWTAGIAWLIHAKRP
jgi:hypothetical protein